MAQRAQPQATERREVLERNHAEVVALLASGATQPEVAQRFGVARSTVLRFVRRNQAEVDAKKQRVALAVEDYHISQKVNRIAAMNDRWQRLQRVIDERAADDTWAHIPGMKTGMMVHTLKGVGKGADFRLVDEFEVDTATLAEIRNIERAAAEELAQIEKAPAANVNIIDKAILVRYIEGPDN